MGKLNSSGQDILSLEDQVLSGIEYWSKEKEARLAYETHGLTLSEAIVRRIVYEKRARVNIVEDLQEIAERLRRVGESLPKKDGKRIEEVLQIMITHYHMLFYFTLYGLEKLQDQYLAKEGEKDEEAVSITQAINAFTRRQEGLQLLPNGQNVHVSVTSPYLQDLDEPHYRDNRDFHRVVQPAIDEERLMPSQI